MLPREGRLKAVKRILSYLKYFSKVRIIVETAYPDHSIYPIEDHWNGREFIQMLTKRSQMAFLLQRDQK
jgi:hypothetical protein